MFSSDVAADSGRSGYFLGNCIYHLIVGIHIVHDLADLPVVNLDRPQQHVLMGQ